MELLLFNERPFIVSPTLAGMFGTNEAIFLQQLHYWLQKSRNVADGKLWVYNSFEEWARQIPFLSSRTIQRIVQRLLEQGVIEVSHHGKGRFDRTNWYTINYEHLKQRVTEYRTEKGMENTDEAIEDDSFPLESDNVESTTMTAEPICLNVPAKTDGMEKDKLSSHTTSACQGEVRHAVASPCDKVSYPIIQKNTTKTTSEYVSDRMNIEDDPYRRLCAMFSHLHHAITGKEAKALRRLYQAHGENATELALQRSEGAHKPLRYMATVLENLTAGELVAFAKEKEFREFLAGVRERHTNPATTEKNTALPSLGNQQTSP